MVFFYKHCFFSRFSFPPSLTWWKIIRSRVDLHDIKEPAAGRKKQTILTISQTNTVGEQHGHRSRRSKTPTSTNVLEKISGKILYKTELDGTVQVCIRAQGASAEHPVRVSLFVATGHDAVHYKHEEMEKHLSKLQIALMKLTDDMDGVLREADMAKTREVEFHNQSASMHAASQWWPILQMVVLLATGFTQASAMIHFFKSKRLV